VTAFGWLVAAEWTKLWSVRRWAFAMLGMVAVTLGFGLLTSMGSGTDANRYPDFVVGPAGDPVDDEFHFVHWPMAGDGSVTARVASQRDSHEWAGAGVMIKQDTASGSPYAAVMVTPRHGVRLSANFDNAVATRPAAAPRWLRLTRAGGTVTGYESADGRDWRPIGTVSVEGLTGGVLAGLFVSSPPIVVVDRAAAATAVGEQPTRGTATFDHVRVDPAETTRWSSVDVRRPPVGGGSDVDPGGLARAGSATEAGGVFRVTGSGEIGPKPPQDDMVQVALFGVFLSVMVAIPVGVLFMTSEYKRGMIRTTLAVHPGRARVLAAKAIVLGASAYPIGLAAAALTLLATAPVLRGRGFAPPAFPALALTDGPVLRAIAGTAAFVALTAVLGLALGALLRHGAAAITAAVLLVTVPAFAAILLPATAAEWLMRVTPTGGLAALRSKPPTAGIVEPWSMIGPGAGLAAAAAYAAAALLAAAWLLRRRDA
jgi:hypothetical protein